MERVLRKVRRERRKAERAEVERKRRDGTLQVEYYAVPLTRLPGRGGKRARWGTDMRLSEKMLKRREKRLQLARDIGALERAIRAEKLRSRRH